MKLHLLAMAIALSLMLTGVLAADVPMTGTIGTGTTGVFYGGPDLALTGAATGIGGGGGGGGCTNGSTDLSTTCGVLTFAAMGLI